MVDGSKEEFICHFFISEEIVIFISCKNDLLFMEMFTS